jgi:hypothetical protein
MDKTHGMFFGICYVKQSYVFMFFCFGGVLQYLHMGNHKLDPHMHNFLYGDCHMHMGIHVCIRGGIAKKNAHGDPILHTEVERIE